LGFGASRAGGLVKDPDSDAFYVRALLHGHLLADEIPLADALRDRAVRILAGRSLGAVLARAAPDVSPEGRASQPDDPARAYPLSLVESMMRAHGLKAYVSSRGP
jgi:lysine-N-methylase